MGRAGHIARGIGSRKKYGIGRERLRKYPRSAVDPVSEFIKSADGPGIIVERSRSPHNAFGGGGQTHIHVRPDFVIFKFDVVVEVIPAVILQYSVILIIRSGQVV